MENSSQEGSAKSTPETSKDIRVQKASSDMHNRIDRYRAMIRLKENRKLTKVQATTELIELGLQKAKVA